VISVPKNIKLTTAGRGPGMNVSEQAINNSVFLTTIEIKVCLDFIDIQTLRHGNQFGYRNEALTVIFRYDVIP
jgi:hypothetical protein